MAYPTIIIYKAVVDYFGPTKINNLFGISVFMNNLILFLLILIPVYIATHRIVESFRMHHNIRGFSESLLLSIGIVLLTIGVCFHVLPDKDVFNLDKPFELFFQSNIGYLTCMVVPMLSVFLMSKRGGEV
jgi:fumarate reductase subunit D